MLQACGAGVGVLLRCAPTALKGSSSTASCLWAQRSQEAHVSTQTPRAPPTYEPGPQSSASPYAFSSQAELVSWLQSQRYITNERVAAVMTQVDRVDFAHTYVGIPVSVSYLDRDVPIGQGQTLSPPSMHARALDLLVDHLEPGARGLDVGAGSGYMAACMALLAGPTGWVTALEKHEKLFRQARWNIAQHHVDLLLRPERQDGRGLPHGDHPRGNVQLVAANVLVEGALDEYEPFDAIHVGAASEQAPEVLLNKLRPGGRMVLPIGKPVQHQVLTVFDKGLDGSIKQWAADAPKVKFMPLTPPFYDKIW